MSYGLNNNVIPIDFRTRFFTNALILVFLYTENQWLSDISIIVEKAKPTTMSSTRFVQSIALSRDVSVVEKQQNIRYIAVSLFDPLVATLFCVQIVICLQISELDLKEYFDERTGPESIP